MIYCANKIKLISVQLMQEGTCCQTLAVWMSSILLFRIIYPKNVSAMEGRAIQ